MADNHHDHDVLLEAQNYKSYVSGDEYIFWFDKSIDIQRLNLQEIQNTLEQVPHKTLSKTQHNDATEQTSNILLNTIKSICNLCRRLYSKLTEIIKMLCNKLGMGASNRQL
jgi:hypothetical protein